MPLTDQVFFDIDMENIAEPDDTVALEVNVGPYYMSPNSGGVFTPRTGANGVRFLEARPSGEGVFSSFSLSPYHLGLGEVTFLLVSRVPESYRPVGDDKFATFTFHAPSASSGIIATEEGVTMRTSNGSTDGLPVATYGDVHVWALVFRFGAETVETYIDGSLAHDTDSNSPYLPTEYYAVIPGGDIYRIIALERALDGWEVFDAAQELLSEYAYQSFTVTWDPPVHDGGVPVTGYVVRIAGAEGIEEHEVGPDVTSLEVLGGEGLVQVVAVNPAGRSVPGEVAP